MFQKKTKKLETQQEVLEDLLVKLFKLLKKKTAKKTYTQNSKERHPYGCVRVCEGARAFGNAGVAVCWCVCAGQFFFLKGFFLEKIFKF